MCGIAGYVNLRPAHPPDGVLERMAQRIEHRGPDGHGYYRDPWAALAHRRLSIIDLASGAQPMTNERENLRIVYNGEIFNHDALRRELEAAGHTYKTRCDTETILHAFEQWGPDCVSHFRGMFAFAIWDRAARRLFCARDRLGIKPFYYFQDGRQFVFASEIKALLAHPSIAASFEESLLPEYLAFGYTSGERTLFSGIRKLLPGHTLDLHLTDTAPRVEIRRYWDVPAPAAVEHRDDASWIRECRERLEETVRMRLMSDVPLGMFLSGGVDSSALAALMQREMAERVQTFSVGYEEAAFSELSYAAQAARAIGTEHHEVTVSMEEFFNALPGLVWHEDEPLAWPSSVSLYFVSKLASSRVKVVLTGEGSDELFGGYGRYGHYLRNQKWMKAWRLAPAGLREAVRSHLASSSLLSASLRRKLGHSFLGRGETVESLYLDNFYCAFSSAAQSGLLARSSTASRGSAYEGFLSHWNATPRREGLARMLYADQKTYLAELLMKQDQMSMAASIESRVPFLDHTFVEFASRVPDDLKIRNGEAKYILKRAVEDLLPREIVYRRKMGFPTPLSRWLLDPKAAPLYEMLERRNGMVAAYCDPAQVRVLLDRHRKGIEDATDRIWRLLNLEIWGEVFLSGKRSDRWEGLLPSSAQTMPARKVS
jgi:asparagine synthase (glutamine-hydrolysing)